MKKHIYYEYQGSYLTTDIIQSIYLLLSSILKMQIDYRIYFQLNDDKKGFDLTDNFTFNELNKYLSSPNFNNDCVEIYIAKKENLKENIINVFLIDNDGISITFNNHFFPKNAKKYILSFFL